MTDSNALRNMIKEKGFKLKFVAEQIGLTTYGLQLKIDNKNEFKTGEISALCELLEISEKAYYSKEYLKNDLLPKGCKDFREIIHPKKDWREVDTAFIAKPYY